MSSFSKALEDVGLYTLPELSRRCGVAEQTLHHWWKTGLLPVLVADGPARSTEHLVELAAERTATKTTGAGRRKWRIVPIEPKEAPAEAAAS